MSYVKYFAKYCILIVFAMASPVHAAVYFVSLGGNNSRLGTSKDAAWRTITYAATKAKAGDTVYIEGGDYGNEKVVFSYSGTSASPIVFEGYNGTPVINQGARSSSYSSIGFRMTGKKYITLRNIGAKLYFSCFQIETCSYITLENVSASTCGYDSYKGYGILLTSCNHCTLKNCTVTDCGGCDYQLSWCDDNVLDGCQAIGTLASGDTYATDYYMVISWSSRNRIRNCTADDRSRTGKGNHGVGLKDTASSDSRNAAHGHSTGNQFIDCKGYSMEEGIFCAHGAYGNTFTNCIGDFKNKFAPFSNGIMVRDGAHDNTFVNCRGIACGEALCIYASHEGFQHAIQSNNKFIDCIFEVRERSPLMPLPTYAHPLACMFLRNAQNNTFENCSFVNARNMFRFGKDYNSTNDLNSGNRFNNCTIYNVQNWYDTQTFVNSAWSYNTSTPAVGYSDVADIIWNGCNFWQNGFSKPATGNNTSYQPIFVDPPTGDYHVRRNAAGRRWALLE